MVERRRNRMILGGIALASLLVLAGCGSSDKEGSHACPQVLILADTERFTQHRPGGGRDITDIEAQGEISGFRGTCVPTETGLDVTLAVSFDLQRGAADSDRVATFSYFIAIPDFYPAAEAKAVLPVRVGFPDGAERVRFVDEEVTLSVPRRDGADPASHDIYIGFQLDPQQLRQNRGN